MESASVPLVARSIDHVNGVDRTIAMGILRAVYKTSAQYTSHVTCRRARVLPTVHATAPKSSATRTSCQTYAMAVAAVHSIDRPHSTDIFANARTMKRL